MENSNNSGKVIGALILGAAIGGVLGILFAPEKGAKTRKKLIGRGQDLTDAIKEKFNGLLTTDEEESETVKHKKNGFIHNGKSKATASKAH